MSEYLTQASYPGEIDINGNRSPASYKLKASKEDDGSIHVAISLTAPRDWLLKHGFSQEATLLRKGGETVPVRSEDAVDVADNVAITLRADDVVCADMDELNRSYPEVAES
jgi:hypothetical protein